MSVEKLNWSDARILMHKANPEFVALLDTVDGIEKYAFTKYSYRYGDLVGDANYFYDPDGNTVSDNIPFGMVVKKSMQFFMELGEYIIPGELIVPGDFAYMSQFSYTQKINILSTWSMCAGTRVPIIVSIYKQYSKYARMQSAMGVTEELYSPSNDGTDFSVIRNIARGLKSDWRFVYIGFSDELTALLKSNSDTWHIREYILKKLMRSNLSSNTKSLYQDIILNYIKVHHSSIKNFYYLSNVINHVLDAVCGYSMIHRLADNDMTLPLQEIQQAYHAFYRPKNPPFILTSSNFAINQDYIHYFSIPYHTMMYRPEHIANIVELCVNVKRLISVYSGELSNIPIVGGGVLLQKLSSIKFSVIADRPNTFQKTDDVLLLKELPLHCKDLSKQLNSYSLLDKKYTMPQRSSFFSGAINMSFE
ncbi:hypothetical protein [Cysteiniphilum halobium]|uniref:hypothetical protein n=1 Tax=Cysteiniphilum halobium TaxID=2219059 RepID=UPI000E65030E|nr:hypothetical protein [Cysteiniphilum halobium]